MERQGRDPRLWSERWLWEKGIERDSKTGHELSVLTNAFYLNNVCAQLNVGGLGALEVICRRIAMLAGRGAQPAQSSERGRGPLPGGFSHER